LVVATSRLKFVFDECLSEKIANTLDHCGKRLVPPISVSYVSSKEKAVEDTTWMPARGLDGFIIVSRDRAMINDHDIAKFAKEHKLIVLLLDQRVARQHRWQMLRWFATFWPKVAYAAMNYAPGSTWIISHDGRQRVVPPDRKIPIEES
jgi:hypothetical protein